MLSVNEYFLLNEYFLNGANIYNLTTLGLKGYMAVKKHQFEKYKKESENKKIDENTIYSDDGEWVYSSNEEITPEMKKELDDAQFSEPNNTQNKILGAISKTGSFINKFLPANNSQHKIPAQVALGIRG